MKDAGLELFALLLLILALILVAAGIMSLFTATIGSAVVLELVRQFS